MIVFLIVTILSFLGQLLLPWWIIVIISFTACSLLGRTARASFLGTFVAVFISWATMCLIKTLPNENILAGRVAALFSVKYWWVMVLITALLGGLVAGVSGFCGYHFKRLWFK